MSGTISNKHCLNFKNKKCYGFSSSPSGYPADNPRIVCKVGEDELYIPTSSSSTNSYNLRINNQGDNLYITKRRIDILIYLYIQFPYSNREMQVNLNKIEYTYGNISFRDFDEDTLVYFGLDNPSDSCHMPSYKYQQPCTKSFTHYGWESDNATLCGYLNYHGSSYSFTTVTKTHAQWYDYNNQTFEYWNTIYL